VPAAGVSYRTLNANSITVEEVIVFKRKEGGEEVGAGAVRRRMLVW